MRSIERAIKSGIKAKLASVDNNDDNANRVCPIARGGAGHMNSTGKDAGLLDRVQPQAVAERNLGLNRSWVGVA
jgi:hypothetical protein